MKQDKNKLIGPLGEIITLTGALCFAEFEGWGAVSAGIVALLIVGMRIYHHDGEEKVFSAVRKLLSLLPAIAVEFGWLEIDKATSLVALLGPLTAIYWSWRANGGNSPTGGSFTWLLLLGAIGCANLLVSCCATREAFSTINELQRIEQSVQQIKENVVNLTK